MKVKLQKHNIEGAFVLVLFAVFAITIVAVLALGANSYKSLVERDNESYNKRIITSYVSAKIRGNDEADAVAVGGFNDPAKTDEVSTLHMYQVIEGQKFDMRIYYFKGQVYELFTTADNKLEPEAGNPIVEAKNLSFTKNGSVITIDSVDADGRADSVTVALRSTETEVQS